MRTRLAANDGLSSVTVERNPTTVTPAKARIQTHPITVIPAKAGIQTQRKVLSMGRSHMGFSAAWRRFERLPKEERFALVCLLPLLSAARLGIWLTSVPRVRSLLGRLVPRTEIPASRLAELVSVACQRLPGFTRCLPRAIVLEALLRSAGKPAELRVGLAPLKPEGRPDAHAWVELDGFPVGETAAGYTALPLFGTCG